MKHFKTLAIAASFVVGSITAASAAVVSQGGYTYTPDAAPLNLEVRYLGIDGVGNSAQGPINSLSVGDVLAGNLTNGQSLAGGMISFAFTATQRLGAVNISTTVPGQPFTDLVLSWCPDGTFITQSSSTCFGATESSITEPLDDKPFSTTFEAGETKWLLATWSGTTDVGSDIDFRVEATAVPVPAAGLLLLGGLGGLAALRRRKKS